MTEMIEQYDAAVKELRDLFEDFMDEADKGKEGRGSKSSALNARKHSSKLATLLKDFRALSISNDKAKPVQKRQASEATY